MKTLTVPATPDARAFIEAKLTDEVREMFVPFPPPREMIVWLGEKGFTDNGDGWFIRYAPRE